MRAKYYNGRGAVPKGYKLPDYKKEKKEKPDHDNKRGAKASEQASNG